MIPRARRCPRCRRRKCSRWREGAPAGAPTLHLLACLRAPYASFSAASRWSWLALPREPPFSRSSSLLPVAWSTPSDTSFRRLGIPPSEDWGYLLQKIGDTSFRRLGAHSARSAIALGRTINPPSSIRWTRHVGDDGATRSNEVPGAGCEEPNKRFVDDRRSLSMGGSSGGGRLGRHKRIEGIRRRGRGKASGGRLSQ
jgi:hypothetical protein